MFNYFTINNSLIFQLINWTASDRKPINNIGCKFITLKSDKYTLIYALKYGQKCSKIYTNTLKS